MSIKGFSVNGVVQRYDYTALDNLPQGQGVSDDLKAALLQLAQKVAYIDDQGQTYYDDLYDALYPEKTLLSITANFQQGQAVVYNTDSLDSLKQYLTVTAIYDDASTETVPSSAYTLSGTLTAGTSVITVTYEGKTDAFNVVVTAAPIALTVTNNLTGCTTSNSATSVLENTSYTAVITASSGYTLVGATVSITMGGNDITTSAYSGGIITINSVTGALVISVTAVAVVLSSISAVYTQSGTVYDTDTLDSLKADLVVTAHYSDSSTQTVPAADYTLSGTLTAGTSTITVAYGGKTTTFNVTVEENLTLFDWDYTEGMDGKINSVSSVAPTMAADGLLLQGGENLYSTCAIAPNIATLTEPYKTTITYSGLSADSDNSGVMFFHYHATEKRVAICRQRVAALATSALKTFVTDGSNQQTVLSWNLTDSGTIEIEYDNVAGTVKFTQGVNSHTVTIGTVSEWTQQPRVASASKGTRNTSVKIQHIRIERTVQA